MRILLVEDDKIIGEALVAALKHEQHAVDWAKDGITADKMLVSTEYQAVLLDLTLPGRDGLDLLRDLRDAVVEQRVRGLDLGADDYVAKPLDISELLARLRAAVRRQGGQARAVLTNGAWRTDPVLLHAANSLCCMRCSCDLEPCWEERN